MMKNDSLSFSHLIEQTWELMHQGQDVNPTDGFLDSVNEYLNFIWIHLKFYIFIWNTFPWCTMSWPMADDRRKCSAGWLMPKSTRWMPCEKGPEWLRSWNCKRNTPTAVSTACDDCRTCTDTKAKEPERVESTCHSVPWPWEPNWSASSCVSSTGRERSTCLRWWWWRQGTAWCNRRAAKRNECPNRLWYLNIVPDDWMHLLRSSLRLTWRTMNWNYSNVPSNCNFALNPFPLRRTRCCQS